MTLQEISAGLVNGFHDAHLENIEIDYGKKVASIRLNVCLGIPSEDEEINKRCGRATLHLHALQYLVIEKPEDNGHGQPSHFDSTVDDFETSTQPDLLKSLPTLLPGVFAHSFFVFGWNCCIHIAAQAAGLNFDDPADRIYNDKTLKKISAGL